jgi:hypothetical protein
VGIFIRAGAYAVTPLLGLYAVGFLATGMIGLKEARRPASPEALPVPAVFGESMPRS